MNAAELTRALGGRWSGSSGKARCPGHDDHDPSLSVRDGDGGRLLTFCHAGCLAEDVWAALQDRGLVQRAEDRPARRGRASPRPEPAPNQAHAIEIWRRGRDPIDTVTVA